jgi:hypothetical protein
MKRPALGHVLGYTALTVIFTAGAAQSLAGTNTVDGGDIVDGTITTSDLKAGAVAGSKILNNAVTGAKIFDNSVTSADVAESSLVLTCPTGMAHVGDVCYGEERPPAKHWFALDDCADEHLRLPTLSEARLVTQATDSQSAVWTDNVFVDKDGVEKAIVLFDNPNWTGIAIDDLAGWAYHCVTTVGARP